MKLINHASLSALFKPDAVITDDANTLANALIIDLNIPAGQGLAVFLGMPVTLDNHKALRRWVQIQLSDETGYVFAEMQSQLEKRLYDLLPHNSFYPAY
ncbi:hypothetical protein [Pseudoalteromonas sp.]|uniref:hypothetical protein n=1 Tax=Pseudoalteromonas sp. TaxID=53249 RepID=UPI00257BEC09|nr:hypothetical protein [Pseudoalteromonas sp.]